MFQDQQQLVIGRRQPPGIALCKASPHTYRTLVMAVALAILPIHVTLVGATRTDDAIGSAPTPTTPRSSQVQRSPWYRC
jgi:hypothetical protein